MKEITKAKQTSEKLINDLREANRKVKPVEGMIVLRLIKKAAELQWELNALENVMDSDEARCQNMEKKNDNASSYELHAL